MLSSATIARREVRGRHLAAELRPDDQRDAGEAEHQTEPPPRRHRRRPARLGAARQPERGQHRLQSDQERRRAGAEPRLHRRPHAAEIAGLHQHSGDGEVQPLRPLGRPSDTRDRDPDDEARRRQREAQRQETEGRRVRHRQPGDDEAGRPDADEEPRHRQREGGAVRGGRAEAGSLAVTFQRTRARISGNAFCR